MSRPQVPSRGSLPAEDLLSPTVPLRGEAKRPVRDDGTDPVPVMPPPGSFVSLQRLTPQFQRGPDSTPIVGSSLLRSGQMLGDYEILEELGRGGMGVIYKAKQSKLKRVVALKVILRGDFARIEEIVRFRSEAEAIASLQHPNLVSIYEIGENDGLPFYAMEYLEGGTLATRISRRPLGPKTAARLMMPLARAIDYAHEHGVIHRDLKPANILLASSAGSIDQVIAKITDFGIAKQVGEDARLTRTGEILGTPAYMAPEQAMGHGRDVGPAADVYSLGAILYEMLTGRPPFVGADPADTLLRVLHEDPLPLRKWNSQVPAELETICLKCLEKNPSRRYASAGQLADDLKRYLSDEPILARPASAAERFRKWVKRSPVKATVMAAGILIALLGFGAVATLWQQALGRAKIEADMVKVREQNLVQVQTLLADALLERGIAHCEKNDLRPGMHWLLRSLEIAEANRNEDSRSVAIAQAARYNLAHWSSHVARSEILLPHREWAWAVDFSPDGKFAVTGSRDKSLRVWDVETGRLIGNPYEHNGPIWAVACHPSGKAIFAAGGDQRGELRVYSEIAGKPGQFVQRGESIPTPVFVRKLILSPCGKFLLVLLANGALAQFDYNPRDESRPLKMDVIVVPSGVVDCAFGARPNTVYVAVGNEVLLVNTELRGLDRPAWKLPGPATAMAVSLDRKRLAVGTVAPGGKDSLVHLWNLETDEFRRGALTGVGQVKALAFSADGRRLATSILLKDDKAGIVGQVRIASFGSSLEASEPYAPIPLPKPVWAMIFHPSGSSLITGCEDFYSRSFDVVTGHLIARPVKHEGNVVNLALSPDGRRLLSASAGGHNIAHARLQELPTLENPPRPVGPNAPISHIQWEGDPHRGYVMDHRRDCFYWDFDKDQLIEKLERPEAPGLDKSAYLFLHPGRGLHCYNQDRKRMQTFDVHTRKLIAEFPDFDTNMNDASCSVVRGQIPMTDRANKRIVMFNQADGTRTGVTIDDVPDQCTNYFTVAAEAGLFGTHIDIPSKIGANQTVVNQSEVRVWNADGKFVRKWSFKTKLSCADLSPKGRYLAVLDGYQVRLYDVATGALVGRPFSHEGEVPGWAFHPSEDIIALGTPTGVKLWHIESGRQIGKTMELGDRMRMVRVRPDGSGYIASSWNRPPIQWRHVPPAQGSVAHLREWVERITGEPIEDSDETLTLVNRSPQ